MKETSAPPPYDHASFMILCHLMAGVICASICVALSAIFCGAVLDKPLPSEVVTAEMVAFPVLAVVDGEARRWLWLRANGR